MKGMTRHCGQLGDSSLYVVWGAPSAHPGTEPAAAWSIGVWTSRDCAEELEDLTHSSAGA